MTATSATSSPASSGPSATVTTEAPGSPTTVGTGDVHGFVLASISVGGRPLEVAVADTPSLRERGLMGVRDLGDLGGMLFVFDPAESVAFWMKDTEIPLDLGFFGVDGDLLSVVTMAPCSADPCPTYPSSSPVGWALEVPQGSFPLVPGDRLALGYPP